MDAGVSREINDTRIAATPKTIAQLWKLGYHVSVESGAGFRTSFSDDAYREVGGVTVNNAQDRDTALAVGAPSDTQLLDMHPEATLASLLAPRQDPSLTRKIAAQGVNAFSTDMVPRTSRVQVLDVLSSLVNISGCRVVVKAARAFGQLLTSQVIAADKVSPATVFVVGTGVAKLTAIGIANSLGVVMRATDVWPETVEQVTSVGATFLHVGQADQGVSSDGCAKEVDADYAARAAELCAAQAREVNIITATATIPGKPSSRLIAVGMVESMKPGSVTVSMVAIGGGDCELTRPGESHVTENGVAIAGYTNLSSRLPGQSSQLYGTNLVNALKLMTPGKGGNLVIDFDGEVARSMTIVRNGEVTFPPPEIKISAAPVPATTARPLAPATPAKPPRPRWYQMAWAGAGSVALTMLLTLAPSPPVGLITIFVSAIIVDYYVVWNTTHVLHTSLMSVANTVSGIIVAGAMTQLPSDNWVVKITAFVAVLIASINVFSGFTVTHHMLNMFRKGRVVLTNLVSATYIVAGLIFILAPAGLSKHEIAKKGNALDILDMVLTLVATSYVIAQPVDGGGFDWTSVALLYGAITIDTVTGTWKACGVEMIGMPEFITLFHSLVGAVVVLVGFNVHLSATHTDVLHAVEAALGIFIGVVTLTGPPVAWDELNGRITLKLLTLPGRSWLNLTALVAVAGFGCRYVATLSSIPLLLVTLISLTLDYHLVTAIGGADVSVMISMLNSYFGQVAASSGFVLDQIIPIVMDALVEASSTILSYIMYRTMNRSFVSVILGGFGGTSVADSGEMGGHREVTTSGAAKMLTGVRSVVVTPGYGMAMTQTQYLVTELTARLQGHGINVRFTIHPAAGRLSGHMNVLLAEAKVPYDIVLGMNEVNDDFTDTNVALMIGINDTVNPAVSEPGSPVSDMPVLKVWEATQVVIFKRSMGAGYAGVQNPLFFNKNPAMCFGDAKAIVQSILDDLKSTTGRPLQPPTPGSGKAVAL